MCVCVCCDELQPRAVRIADPLGGSSGGGGVAGGLTAKGPAFLKPTTMHISNLALLPLHQVALVGYDDGTLKICY
jgi:hypothetical protein